MQAFPRKKDIAKPRPVDRRSGMAKAVRDQLLEEFPWLTEADVGVALAGRASRSTTVGDEEADRKRPAKVLDAEEVEDIVLQTSKELAAQRLELSHGDDDTHFYTRVPGGNWTKQFLKTAANGSMVCGRSHTAKFCKLNSWPFQKTYFFSAWTQEGANHLARLWARMGNHFFQIWADAGEKYDFVFIPAHAESIEENQEFLDWACSLDVASEVFAEVMRVRSLRPGADE